MVICIFCWRKLLVKISEAGIWKNFSWKRTEKYEVLADRQEIISQNPDCMFFYHLRNLKLSRQVTQQKNNIISKNVQIPKKTKMSEKINSLYFSTPEYSETTAIQKAHM